MIQTETAEFDGAQPLDGDLPYIDVTWGTAYDDADSYNIGVGVNIGSGGAIVPIFKSKTGAGVRVLASDQFTGTVELTAVPR